MNAISNSQRLRQRLEPALPELSSATGAVIMHPQFPRLCSEFLITVHQMIRASVPLMRTALARCLEIRDGDPVADAMVTYFQHHIKEEMHHDDWLLEDLEFIGIPRAQVLGRMPPSVVASLIGAQYYWIHHHHPVAKLGQIAVMEGYPPTLEAIDLLTQRSGYPRKAFRTIEKHSHLDTHHRDEFNDALDEMPLQDEHHAIIEASALHTIRMSRRVYLDLVNRFERSEGLTLMPLRRDDVVTRPMDDPGEYRVEHAARGAVYQIGEHEHFLLTQCDGRNSVEAARRAFAERFNQPLSETEMDEFLQMASDEELVASEPDRL